MSAHRVSVADSEQGETFQEALVRLASEWRAREQETKCPDVVLNVYDMLPVNNYVYRLGLGAYHTGVEVYGKEYAYGCHPYSYTGIYNMEPRQIDEIAGQRVRFREAIRLGPTHLSDQEVRELIVSLGKEYNGCDYSILNRNCNHFTSDFCHRLCGATPPRWINRLAYLGSWLPFVLNCIPPQVLTSASSQSASVQSHEGEATPRHQKPSS